jgi:hypothetical protein
MSAVRRDIRAMEQELLAEINAPDRAGFVRAPRQLDTPPP